MPAKRQSPEVETIIIFNEVEEEARLWTAERKVAKAWEKAGAKLDERRWQNGGKSWWAKVPKGWVSVRAPKKWD